MPTKLFYPGKGERGKSITVATRIAPEINVALERMIESGKTPWQSKSEFIRDAIASSIEEYLGGRATQDELMPQVLSVIRKLQERNFKGEVKERIAETVCSASREIELYVSTKEYDRAIEELEDICSIVLSLRDDPFWLKLTVMQFMQNEVIAEAFGIAADRGPEGCIAEVLNVYKDMKA